MYMAPNKPVQWAILCYQRKPFHLPLQQEVQYSIKDDK